MDKENEENLEQNDQQEQQDVADTTPNDEQNQDEKPEGAQGAVESVLEDLGLDQTDDVPQDDQQDQGQVDPVADNNQPEQKQEGQAAPAPKAIEKDADIEADLLKGVRSERGKERLQKMLNERKEARTQLESMQNYIQASGLDADGFANLMGIARLVSSNNPAEQKQGLQALETVRAELYKQIGLEAPGIDLLADHKDLKQKVDDMELTREDALDILRGRNVQAKQIEEVQRRQAIEAKQKELQGFGDRAVKAFSARSSEPAFNAKVEAMQKYFAVPGRLQQFVSTHSPETWESALLWMYDNIAVQPTPQRQSATPITQQRARSTGTRVTTESQGSAAGVAALMDSLGL